MRAAVSLFLAASLCGCSGPREQRPPTPAAAPSAAQADAPEAWSREGLEAQPQIEVLKQRTPSATGYAAGTTPWMAMSPRPQSGDADSPGTLLASLTVSQGWAAVLGDAAWEQVMRVFIEENMNAATGVVLQWGFMDDAVAGRDFRVSMRRTGAVWRLERVEQRYHCRRGVTAEGRCL